MKNLIRKILKEDIDWIEGADPWSDIPEDVFETLTDEDLELIKKGFDFHEDSQRGWAECYKNYIKVIKVVHSYDFITVDFKNTCVDERSEFYNVIDKLRLNINKRTGYFEIDAL
jgi:hypothetical protein